MRATRVLMVAAVASAMVGSPASCRSPFFIYFEFGSAEIGVHGRNTLAQAAEAIRVSRNPGIFHLRLQAHTDTAGPSAYNLKLARRRGEAARAKLIRLGVSPSIITVEALGEAQPAVETGNGVASENNRRALLIFNSIAPS